jgi:hypothetical protein
MNLATVVHILPACSSNVFFLQWWNVNDALHVTLEEEIKGGKVRL